MQEKIMNMFRQFKLGNSLFKDEFKVSRFETSNSNIPKDDFERIVKRQSVERLASFILKNCPTAINKIDDYDFIIWQTELLVLEMKDFKSIVEAAIQLISSEDIEKIKNGKNVL